MKASARITLQPRDGEKRGNDVYNTCFKGAESDFRNEEDREDEKSTAECDGLGKPKNKTRTVSRRRVRSLFNQDETSVEKDCKTSAEDDYFPCLGIDTFEFRMTTHALFKFLAKQSLLNKIKPLERNKTLTNIVRSKYKKQILEGTTKLFYISCSPRAVGLSNSVIIMIGDANSVEKARKNKKQLNNYAKVVLPSLHQPTKYVYSYMVSTIRLFLKRFKIYSCDMALDFKNDKPTKEVVNNVLRSVKEYLNTEDVSAYRITNSKTVYFNTKPENGVGIEKIVLYNKFDKQTMYNKDKVNLNFKDWHRLEMRFVLNRKYRECYVNNKFMWLMYDLVKISKTAELIGSIHINYRTLQKQLKYFGNIRSKTVFMPEPWLFVRKKQKEVSNKNEKYLREHFSANRARAVA